MFSAQHFTPVPEILLAGFLVRHSTPTSFQSGVPRFLGPITTHICPLSIAVACRGIKILTNPNRPPQAAWIRQQQDEAQIRDLSDHPKEVRRCLEEQTPTKGFDAVSQPNTRKESNVSHLRRLRVLMNKIINLPGFDAKSESRPC